MQNEKIKNKKRILEARQRAYNNGKAPKKPRVPAVRKCNGIRVLILAVAISCSRARAAPLSANR